MACHGCAKSYSFLNKEHGCPNCGFSYCSNCLKFKAIIPKLDRTAHHVCRSCHVALTDVGSKSAMPDHPAAFLQRLESLENPAKPPITVYQHDHRMQQLKRGMTQSDQELAERLERLKESRKMESLPSDDEIAKRLAILKGENPLPLQQQQNLLWTANSRTSQQQSDDLIKQFQEELELSCKNRPEDDIARRLAHLRGQDPPCEVGHVAAKSASTAGVESMSESLEDISLNEANALLAQLRSEANVIGNDKEAETAAKECLKTLRKKIMKKKKSNDENSDETYSESEDQESTSDAVIKRVLAEAALEDKMLLSDTSDEGTGSDKDELPWCVICNENAKRRCEGCDGDLYCDSCFKQGHKDGDMMGHKSTAFKQTKKHA